MHGRQVLMTAVAALSIGWATSAAAHASLVASTPAANSQAPSPRVITLTFSEKLVPAFSAIDLVGPDGRTISVKAKVGKDGKTLSGPPPARLAPGAYKLSWRIASSDGHRMTGGFGFKIR